MRPRTARPERERLTPAPELPPSLTRHAPAFVLGVLEEVLRVAPPLRAAIVHGSLGRGEFSVLETSGGPLPLSDVELVLVPRRRREAPAVRKALAGVCRRIELDSPAAGPFFGVDASVVSAAGLRRLPRWLLTFEKREGSVILGDPGVRDLIPRVTPRNIDLRESNETLVWRLLHLLHHAPACEAGWEAGEGLGPRVWAYLCYRDVLDVGTWLCPHLGILTPGLANRADALRRHPRKAEMESAFGTDFMELMDAAVAAKRDPSGFACPDVRTLHARVTELLAGALEAVTRPDAPGAALLYTQRNRPRTPFVPPWNPRRAFTLLRRRRDRVGAGRPRSMLDTGRRLVGIHRALSDGSVEPRELPAAVHDVYEGLRGFVEDVDGRLRRYDALQMWWRRFTGEH